LHTTHHYTGSSAFAPATLNKWRFACWVSGPEDIRPDHPPCKTSKTPCHSVCPPKEGRVWVREFHGATVQQFGLLTLHNATNYLRLHSRDSFALRIVVAGGLTHPN